MDSPLTPLEKFLRWHYFISNTSIVAVPVIFGGILLTINRVFYRDAIGFMIGIIVFTIITALLLIHANLPRAKKYAESSLEFLKKDFTAEAKTFRNKDGDYKSILVLSHTEGTETVVHIGKKYETPITKKLSFSKKAADKLVKLLKENPTYTAAAERIANREH